MHKTTSIFLLFIILTASLFTACDEIAMPYSRNQDNGGDDTINGGEDSVEVVQKVLVEEFTGHKCPNCPEAHVILADLKDQYGENLVVISIHAGFFARPDNSGQYTMDFRTGAGETMNDFFDVAEYPSGMINRGKDQENLVLNKDIWRNVIGRQAGQKAKAVLDFEVDYNQQNRTISADFDIEFVEQVEGNYKLSAFITEDSIIAPQKNNNENIGPSNISDYEHNHVLRSTLNGTWGETVSEETITPQTTYSLSYNGFDIPENWNVDKLSLVAFVYKEETYEVIQTEKMPFK
ncbi:MAG: Omp28 family outer membrane lipoprotein [Bacteroidales bacterium]|nr:Omp28 family outer membrane lipoprotein [Bacteroidales bacterium]MCF8332590.1 Omp28 family outer membrane lipoprotein [Bacteroidales bacterium]